MPCPSEYVAGIIRCAHLRPCSPCGYNNSVWPNFSEWVTLQQYFYNRPSNFISRGCFMKNRASNFISRGFSWKSGHHICYRDMLAWQNSHQIVYREVVVMKKALYPDVFSWTNRPSNCISRGFFMEQPAMDLYIESFFMKKLPSNFISTVFFMK